MKKQVKRYLGFIVLGIALATVGVAGQANAVTYTATSGSLAASAAFEINAIGRLVVVLTNTSTADVLVPADVLTAVFFSSNGTLTPVSAALNGGSSVLFDAAPAGGVVGGEWGYGSGLVGAPLGATQGISSSGFGLFGGSTFPGDDLDDPAALNGLNYGITSAGDDAGTGNAKVTGDEPLIRNSVVFTFTTDANGNGFTLASIDKVSFQYGTSLTEPNITPPNVPEPASALLLGSGLVAVGLWRRVRKAAYAG